MPPRPRAATPRVASHGHPHAEVERLFLAADRHLCKVDTDVRRCIMENAASVLTSGEAEALDDLARFVAALDNPEGPRASFLATMRKAVMVTRELVS